MDDTGPRERWLLAGQVLLRRGGIREVKLEALTSETGLTTGSFYHHFGGVEAYLDELASYFGADQIEAGLAEIDDPDPRTKLSNVIRRTRDDDMTELYDAMRSWAESSPLALEATEAADRHMLTFLEVAFEDLGHDADAARLRALLLMSVGVARIHTPWRLPRNFREQVLALLVPDGRTT